MNNTPAVFSFNSHTVRTIEKDGELWFVAKDVCDVLGYANGRDAISKHCKGGSETRLPSSGGNQSVSIIPERDVYRLIMRSKLPAAEQFENWIVSEVLPQIRKTGSYAVPQDPIIMLRMEQLTIQKQVNALAGRVEDVAIDRDILFDELDATRKQVLNLERRPVSMSLRPPTNPITTAMHDAGYTVRTWSEKRGFVMSSVRNVLSGLSQKQAILNALTADGFTGDLF